ncbi:hypothetical protein EJB05_13980, partial [Eragrostis curvula]
MERCSMFTAPSMEAKRIHDLQRLLLRVRVILEEAEGRHITNQVMAHQLNMLRREMYRGYFTIDAMRCQCIKPTDIMIGDTREVKGLQQVLDNLNNIMINVSELVTFLNKCPPLCRQPTACIFLLASMEMDRVIDFIMQMEHPSTKSIGVLPIVGPPSVGKSTIVAHICDDARVRSYISKILVLADDDISYEKIATTRDQRLLTIIEFSRDVDEAVWNNFYLFSTRWLARGSKMFCVFLPLSHVHEQEAVLLPLVFGDQGVACIVLAGRPGPSFANTTLRLCPEAYWYFFKVLAFGIVDSSDHPKLEAIAMEMARCMKGSFIAARATHHKPSDGSSTQHVAKRDVSGLFTMDTIRCQHIETHDHDVTYSFALSEFNSRKRIFLSDGDTYGEKELQQILDNMNNI